MTRAVLLTQLTTGGTRRVSRETPGTRAGTRQQRLRSCRTRSRRGTCRGSWTTSTVRSLTYLTEGSRGRVGSHLRFREVCRKRLNLTTLAEIIFVFLTSSTALVLPSENARCILTMNYIWKPGYPLLGTWFSSHLPYNYWVDILGCGIF